ncbi:hypothetical protein [Haladaptatus halobius]|uniref:hypothetical protein n=1 Tax=Haladaptatus halobius TaxID=2884875 RepID=UPI001D0A3CD5|nr:hypothetical protein [Haladaptatus halobius]
MVGLSPDVLSRYPRFSLYNSPYVAHDEGCAIDLYPGSAGRPPGSRAGSEATRETSAPSPVAGEVVAVRSVTAPPKPYAVARDHLIVVDTGEYLVRMLHVEPNVEPGDRIEVGDSLGELVRSGFFAPWVSNHIHLGFRERDANPMRASGSLPIEVPVDIEPLAWDGSGRVVATAETFVVLDSPIHPAPGERFAGIAGVMGDELVVLDSPIHPAPGERFAGIAGVMGDELVVLDGGLPHYEGGGALSAGSSRSPDGDCVSLVDSSIGVVDGRTVTWDDVTVRANERPITGLSLFVSREQFGAKLVCPGHEFRVGNSISVSIR